MKEDLFARATRFADQPDVADTEAGRLITELLAALHSHERDAVRALWSVVKAQGGYARVPRLFVSAMGPADKLDVQIETGGEAVIYKAVSSANAPSRGVLG